ncbi:MAG: hypothetical protein AAFY20_18725 [Cyanobacteria bacterium J06639_14]
MSKILPERVRPFDALNHDRGLYFMFLVEDAIAILKGQEVAV